MEYWAKLLSTDYSYLNGVIRNCPFCANKDEFRGFYTTSVLLSVVSSWSLWIDFFSLNLFLRSIKAILVIRSVSIGFNWKTLPWIDQEEVSSCLRYFFSLFLDITSPNLNLRYQVLYQVRASIQTLLSLWLQNNRFRRACSKFEPVSRKPRFLTWLWSEQFSTKKKTVTQKTISTLPNTSQDDQ